MVAYAPSPDFMGAGGRKAHLIGCLAGRGAPHKHLGIKSQAEVERNGRRHHRFLPFCATEHAVRKGQGGKGHEPPETGHGNCRVCLGAVSEAVLKVRVPYLPGVSLPLHPPDLNP